MAAHADVDVTLIVFNAAAALLERVENFLFIITEARNDAGLCQLPLRDAYNSPIFKCVEFQKRQNSVFSFLHETAAI